VLVFTGGQAGGGALFESACLRVGIVFCLAWLAWPELSRLPPAMYLSLGIGGLVVAKWKRAIFIIAPLIVAIWFLQPRGKRRKGSEPPRRSDAERRSE